LGQLTDRGVRAAATGRHSDGDGLHLVVSKTGAKKWVFRFQLDGVRRDMGLGTYPTVSLSDARVAASDARKLIAGKTDPLAARQNAKKAQKPIPTFADVAKLVIAEAQAKSTNAKVRYQWERHLGPAYCGLILEKPVNEISTLDVAGLLRPVWTTKPEVARKLYPAIRRVFEHARVLLRDEHDIVLGGNPALWADLKALGFSTVEQLSRGSHPSLPYDQLSKFIADLRTRTAIAARGLEFLILTNVRTDAVIHARWEQVDFQKAIWTVPLENLKDRSHRKEPFRVPLSSRAIEILSDMKAAAHSAFIFPGPSGIRPISNMAMLTVLRRMNGIGDKPKWIDPKDGRTITAHGFRATFRTWAEETTGFPHAVVEQAMGHQVGTIVERAYRRTDVLDQRRQLMDAWAEYAEGRGLAPKSDASAPKPAVL